MLPALQHLFFEALSLLPMHLEHCGVLASLRALCFQVLHDDVCAV